MLKPIAKHNRNQNLIFKNLKSNWFWYIFLFIYAKWPEKPPLIIKEALPVKTFVDSCLERIGVEATHKLTEFGGNINELVFDEIPTIRQMENNISNYVNGNIDSCLNDFEEFKSRGFEITAKEHEVKTSINKKDVTFLLKFPIEVKKSGKSENLKEFHFQYYEVNIPYLREIAVEILNTSEFLDLNWLANKLKEPTHKLKVVAYGAHLFPHQQQITVILPIRIGEI